MILYIINVDYSLLTIKFKMLVAGFHIFLHLMYDVMYKWITEYQIYYVGFRLSIFIYNVDYQVISYLSYVDCRT